jgi:hypothetical protein
MKMKRELTYKVVEYNPVMEARVYPVETVPGPQWLGGWVGPTTGLDAMEKSKISCPYRASNPPSSSL